MHKTVGHGTLEGVMHHYLPSTHGRVLCRTPQSSHGRVKAPLEAASSAVFITVPSLRLFRLAVFKLNGRGLGDHLRYIVAGLFSNTDRCRPCQWRFNPPAAVPSARRRTAPAMRVLYHHHQRVLFSANTPDASCSYSRFEDDAATSALAPI
jgi:hypothetical protein